MRESIDITAQAKRAEQLRFAGRVYRLRVLGLGTGALAVGGALHQIGGVPVWVWVALAVNGFLWPQLAYLLARRSADPEKAEFRNLEIDSACGGFWIAMMQFNIVPSALLAAMLLADKVGVGGWRFMARTATLQAIACGATSALLGFPFQPGSTMLTILCSLPFLFVYPVSISSATHTLGRKVIRQNRLLDRLNRTDILTGLWNRRHWEEAAARELSRSTRSGRPSALLLVDIDRFKEINDAYGHATGDAVLRRIGSILRECTREIDTAARFGGDEFGVVLVETNHDGAMEVAERIRAMVEAMHLDDAPNLRCTVSIGVAGADPRSRSSDVGSWMRRADRALYRGKQAGRNRVSDDAD